MKKIISLLLVLAMALTLVACGASEEKPAETQAAAPAAPAAPEAAAPAEKVEVNMIAAQYGNELCAAADPGMAAWIDVIGSAKFYPAAKAEWADVKLGVIDVQQQVLLGGDAQELLNELQAEIAD